jgi:UPF0755 protein
MKLLAFVSVALLVVLAGCLVVLSLHLPYAGFETETLLDIPKGTATRDLARLLSDTGVVKYRWQFLLTRALRPGVKLHAGEYLFQRPASVWQVFDRLARGDVFYYEFTVPEGHNLYDVAALVDQLGLISSEEFFRAARDSSAVRDLAPEAPTLEGYLFPDTYRITRHTSAEQLCLQMTERFRKAWSELSGSAPVHATVTLASLIEKEAALDEERPLIASVFVNRLRINMSLDCDPTAIYAALLEGRYRGSLYRSDLENKHRYNTYQHLGLPPGPIANPGVASLKAALEPADTGYLYFVVRPDGSGAHVFSKEFRAHQRAVRRYRRGSQKANQKSTTQRISGSGRSRANY